MQDIDLMMSLWADEATFSQQGDPNSPYVGSDQLRAFWQSSGSFKNRRLSLVPSFKIQIDVKRLDEGWLYFECHDLRDYDQPTAERGRLVDIALCPFISPKTARHRIEHVYCNTPALLLSLQRTLQRASLGRERQSTRRRVFASSGAGRSRLKAKTDDMYKNSPRSATRATGRLASSPSP